MDNQAMYKFSYGLFVLTVRENGFDNGCIINTAIQVTSSPNQIAVTVNKANRTHDMIQKAGVFNISMLSEAAPFSVFQQFGFQSGKNADKFKDFEQKERSENGVYYITEYANAYVSARVVKEIDLGTHTMFLAEATDAKVLSELPSVTYTYYQEHIKPKPEEKKTEKTAWVCKICGYVYEGEELPADFICPICKHGAEDFERR